MLQISKPSLPSTRPNLVKKTQPNGCSIIPWKTPYEECCNQHDIAYVEGSSKIDADWVLRQCMIAEGYPVRAWAIWSVLQTGGWPYYWFGKYILGKYDVKDRNVILNQDIWRDASEDRTSAPGRDERAARSWD